MNINSILEYDYKNRRDKEYIFEKRRNTQGYNL